MAVTPLEGRGSGGGGGGGISAVMHVRKPISSYSLLTVMVANYFPVTCLYELDAWEGREGGGQN